jgi:hypothetical protein
MKVAPTKQADPRIAEIQRWISQFGSSIGNAQRVNKSELDEIGATSGTVMQVIWRLAKAEPPVELNADTMLGILEERALLREVKKQLKLSSKEVKSSEKNFEKSRDVWVASLVPQETPDRGTVVKAVQRWVKTELPDLRDREAIMEAAALRVEAGVDFRTRFVPVDATAQQINDLEEKHPGRVYRDSRENKVFLVLKPNEKAEVTQRGLVVSATTPEIS